MMKGRCCEEFKIFKIFLAVLDNFSILGLEIKYKTDIFRISQISPTIRSDEMLFDIT